MTEANIQKAVIKYARDRMLVAIKLTTLGPRGTTGWPDYLLLGPNHGVMFIEFKQKGKTFTPKQAYMANLLRERTGFEALIVDDVEGGKIVVDSFFRACRLGRVRR